MPWLLKSGLMLALAAGGAEAIMAPSSFIKITNLLGVDEAPSPSPAVGESSQMTETLKWWKKYLRIQHAKKHEKTPAEELRAFIHSAIFEEWAAFAVLWLVLFRLSWYMEGLDCSNWYQHLLAVGVWVAAAALFLGCTCLYWGPEAGEDWLDGYLMEMILSMENIFLYEILMVSFKVPAKMARYALFIVSLWQMLFQMFLFMGVATLIESWKPLPYLLGAWLIFVAVNTLREDEHESFDATTSESYKAFRLFVGTRLLPEYTEEGTIFVTRGGRVYVTMLGPVVCCLLLIMFAMEVDVTLTKIEEISNHFLAWSSSVLAVFALPELFVVVREMMRRFYLLKTGIGGLLLIFGGVLLLRSKVEVSEATELIVMVSIVIGSILLSKLLGYSARDSLMYEESGLSKKNTHTLREGSDAFEDRPSSEEQLASVGPGPAGQALDRLQAKPAA